MRISFLILLLNAFLLTQAASAVNHDAKVKGALLKAIKTHDTEMVNAIASGGYESIDRDDVLQEKIYNYLEAERQRAIAAEEKAKQDAIAAKKAAQEKAKQDAIAAEQKKKADAIAKQNASAAAAAALVAKKAADAKKKEEAAAAKKRADAKRKADQKAAAEKKKRDAAAKKRRDAAAKKKREAAAAEKKKKQAQAAERKRKEAAAKKKATPKKATPKKAAPKKSVAPKVTPKAVVAPAAAAATAAAVNEPVSVSNKKLIGTWKQISSEKVITFTIEANRDFTLEQVEDDGTLTIMGKWKSEENILMLSIKRVQRNVHTRETDIHRIYKVERLSNHRLVLKDKRNRIAYDLKR